MTDHTWINILYFIVGTQGFFIAWMMNKMNKIEKRDKEVLQKLTRWEEIGHGLQETDSRIFKMLHEMGDMIKSLARKMY